MGIQTRSLASWSHHCDHSIHVHAGSKHVHLIGLKDVYEAHTRTCESNLVKETILINSQNSATMKPCESMGDAPHNFISLASHYVGVQLRGRIRTRWCNLTFARCCDSAMTLRGHSNRFCTGTYGLIQPAETRPRPPSGHNARYASPIKQLIECCLQLQGYSVHRSSHPCSMISWFHDRYKEDPTWRILPWMVFIPDPTGYSAQGSSLTLQDSWR